MRRVVTVTVILAVVLGVLWLARREPAAEKCERIRRASAEARGTQLVREQGSDTSFVPTPPPRPSELAWYAEHCFEGKPR